MDLFFQTYLIHRDLKITRVKQNLTGSSLGSCYTVHNIVNKIKFQGLSLFIYETCTFTYQSLDDLIDLLILCDSATSYSC